MLLCYVQEGDVVMMPLILKLPIPRCIAAEYGSFNNAQYRHSATPPSLQGSKEVRRLADGWTEFVDESGRSFYCCGTSGELSWKPPRKKKSEIIEDVVAGQYITVPSKHSPSPQPGHVSPNLCIDVPHGWHQFYNEDVGQICYINKTTGAKWYHSQDSENRVYFFEEHSNESSWTLPEVSITHCGGDEQTEVNTSCDSLLSKSLLSDPGGISPRSSPPRSSTLHSRLLKTQSMVDVDSRKENVASSVPAVPKSPDPFSSGVINVIKEGSLNKTKITENGKKLRKNWTSSYVVLTDVHLIFFKDEKTYLTLASGKEGRGSSKPEMCVDLNRALIEWSRNKSSRRNVFLVTTCLGVQILLQDDNLKVAEEWFNAVLSASQKLLSNFNTRLKNTPKDLPQLPKFVDMNSPEETRKFRLGRTKSVKIKQAVTGSIEDLTAITADKQVKIKAKLKKFFNRRPTVDSLVKKGIFKDEPVFGCTLEKVCSDEHGTVPYFVQHCIEVIEGNEENMKTDGLYRASGNLSQVQKIRCQVDQGNFNALEAEEDVHVLTGALKLFFRELKEPLIPYDLFQKSLEASNQSNRSEKIHQYSAIVRALPEKNYRTLVFLLKHLLRVTEYKDFNRMHIANLAIVFGPTLMWSKEESANMALDLMQQNLVIEFLLQEFESVFR